MTLKNNSYAVLLELLHNKTIQTIMHENFIAIHFCHLERNEELDL